MSIQYSEQMKEKVLKADATQLASLIKKNEMTSEVITTILINHIKHINPALNAVVEERFEAALEEAKQKDKQIHNDASRNKRLFGVPISIKESLNVKGMKTTGGIYFRKDIMMNNDATVVRSLKNEGAIILCKTNTPALCFCHETDNKLYGRTNNSWDKTRTAGGSSGGEAALISAGGSPVGMSSDIGGSIRFPSHFNGVVGFKPGINQVSTEGHLPTDSIPLKARMATVGPIGKTVRDVQMMYDITKQTPNNQTVFEKMNIEILPNENGYPLSKDTKNMLHNVFEAVSAQYHTTKTIPPYFNDSAQIWQEIMSIDGAKEIKQIAFNTDRPNVWKHYLQEKLMKNTVIHPYLSWALIGANMFKPSDKRLKEIMNLFNEGDHVLNSYLQNRLLLFPVYHRGALKHGELYKEIFSIRKSYLKYMPYTAYANVWGLPSLTVPIGSDENNMPIGIQIMSKIGNEKAIFKLGKWIERTFGGYKRSTVYD